MAKSKKNVRRSKQKTFKIGTVFEGSFGTGENQTKVKVTSVKKGWRKVHIKQKGHKEIVINVRPKKVNEILIDERFKSDRARAGGIYHELDAKVLTTYKMLRKLEGVSKANRRNGLGGTEFDYAVKKAIYSKDPDMIADVYNLIFSMDRYEIEAIFDYKKDVTGKDVTDVILDDDQSTAFIFNDTGSRTISR